MKKKKVYKIIKTEHFKKQVAGLPKEIEKELNKAIKKIAKDPINVLGSMNVFGPPSAQELKQWMARIKAETTDLVFEYLANKGCLNKKGLKLAKEFFDKYIKDKK